LQALSQRKNHVRDDPIASHLEAGLADYLHGPAA